jgi:hypothetical protein
MGINSGSLLFKKVYGGKATSDNRRSYSEEPLDSRLSIHATDIWSDSGAIPYGGIGDATGSVIAGETTSSGIVTYHSASGFGSVVGTEAGWSASHGDIIPFNFGDPASRPYAYKLVKNDGTPIPSSDASEWTFDTPAGLPL